MHRRVADPDWDCPIGNRACVHPQDEDLPVADIEAGLRPGDCGVARNLIDLGRILALSCVYLPGRTVWPIFQHNTTLEKPISNHVRECPLLRRSQLAPYVD